MKGAVAAFVILLWALGLFALAGFDVGRFFDVLELPLSWGVLVIAVVAFAVLARIDLVASWSHRTGARVEIDTDEEDS